MHDSWAHLPRHRCLRLPGTRTMPASRAAIVKPANGGNASMRQGTLMAGRRGPRNPQGGPAKPGLRHADGSRFQRRSPPRLPPPLPRVSRTGTLEVSRESKPTTRRRPKQLLLLLVFPLLGYQQKTDPDSSAKFDCVRKIHAALPLSRALCFPPTPKIHMRRFNALVSPMLLSKVFAATSSRLCKQVKWAKLSVWIGKHECAERATILSPASRAITSSLVPDLLQVSASTSAANRSGRARLGMNSSPFALIRNAPAPSPETISSVLATR